MIDYQSPTAMLNAIRGGQINVGTLTDDTEIGQVKAAGYTVYGEDLNFFGLLLFDRGGSMTKAWATCGCGRRSTTPWTGQRC